MRPETANILSLLDKYTQSSIDDVSMKIAANFKNRRIEKGITREQMAEKSGVAISNIARFEQKGLISLKNLIKLAEALGYLAEIQNLFSQPKFTTIEELTQIRKNANKKKAYSGTKKYTNNND